MSRFHTQAQACAGQLWEWSGQCTRLRLGDVQATQMMGL